MNLPTDIANQALDAAGLSEMALGDLEEGTIAAQVCLRAYAQCRRQLLRAAHWDFARKTSPMMLLADRSGNTPNVGMLVVDPRFQYEYGYPIDCLKARFIPWNYGTPQVQIPPGNIQLPTTPLMTGQGLQPVITARIRPARFTVATDQNYPAPPGTQWWTQQGQSPSGSTVVLTNVQQALLVYTADMIYPNMWDASFRAAMVAYLASEICLPLHKDKKLGMQMRVSQIDLAKQKITQARISDGNEGWYSSDVAVDWMRARATGTGYGWGTNGWGGGGGEAGCFGYGWDSCGFSDGSAY